MSHLPNDAAKGFVTRDCKIFLRKVAFEASAGHRGDFAPK
jgi:hypothetical protein